MSSPSSSAAWSDSGDEAADQNASASTSTAVQESALTPSRPRHGEKAAFQPPPGYLPSYFSKQLTSTFGYDALKADQQKQLWVVKIPEGVSAAALDGLVIDVSAPSDSSLADISVPVKAQGGASSQGHSKRYSLRRRPAASSKRREVGGSTQLIMMAGGSKALSADDNEDSNEQEREAFRVLVPHASSAGRYVFAPKPIEQTLHLVLDGFDKQASAAVSPAPNSTTTGQPTGTGQKRKREQPIAKLNGRFMPSGSRTKEPVAEEKIDQSPVKAKKSKKVKLEGEGSVEESKPRKTSVSPKKSKKGSTPTKKEA